MTNPPPTDERSLAEIAADLPPADLARILADMSADDLAALQHSYGWFARPKQLPPEGDWGTWLIRAGRGFGKTFAGSGWTHERAMAEKRWIALIAKTPADARDYMIEGPGGIMRNVPPWERPAYEPTKRRLTWPNGSWATIYSSEAPDQLRGFSGDTAWLDELAKFDNPAEVWRMLAFGMREASSDRPRRLITTTPRPLAILQEIERQPSTVVVVGHSEENRRNLSDDWYAEVIEPLVGTRLYRQEVAAEILVDVEGSLFPRPLIDRFRVNEHPELRRIVVGVDPSGTSTGDRTGIVVCGLGVDGHGYVLADWSLRASPDEWARRVAQAYHAFQADEAVCETNYGADLAISVLKQADPDVRVRKVTATRGKSVRAAPVSLKYERGEVHHMAGADLEQLEDELVLFNADGQPIDPSPDRADACIWALTALITATRSRFAFVGADVPPSREGAAVSDPASGWPSPGRAFISRESLRNRFL